MSKKKTSKKAVKNAAKKADKRSAPPSPKTSKPKLNNAVPLPEPKPVTFPLPPALAPAHSDPHEAMRFVLGPNEPANGSTLDHDEEARRQRALVLEVQRLAKEFGLDATPQTTYTPEATPTARANDIKQLAAPQMNQAADDIRAGYAKIKITDPQGRSIEVTKIWFNARNVLRASIGGIADLIGMPFKYALGLTIKCGKWAKLTLTGKAQG